MSIPRKTAARGRRTTRGTSRGADVVAQLQAIERAGGSGTVRIPREGTLDVTNLDKVYFPESGHTKGDVMRYYAAMARAILPVMKDRPLALKRFPNGIAGESFFQQKAPPKVPDGVRVERVRTEEQGDQPRLIGGNLTTLLYVVQLGAIQIDAWHSRIGRLRYADYAIVDLDPGPGAPFARVVQVARWVGDAMDALGVHGFPKTSGATGIHIYLPLPPRTPDETALALAQRIAERVTTEHPRETTTARGVEARGESTVYVDFLQNAIAKTVAAAYSVRPRPGATVSTPLEWGELDASLDPRRFTIDTVPERVREKGDLWAAAMKRRNTGAKVTLSVE